MKRGGSTRKWVLLATAACLVVLAIFWMHSRIDSASPVAQASEARPEHDLDVAGDPPLDAAGVETRRDRTEARAPETAPLVVQVSSDLDRPVAEVHVLLLDAQSLLGNATTGADGTCSFPSSTGDGSLIAWIDGRVPVRQSTSLAAGRTTIRIPAGARVAGAARRLDGQPAAKLPLLLESDRPFFDAKDLPPAVREALPNALQSGNGALGATDANGRFAFDGLDPAWKGSLCVERMHWLLEASQGSLRKDAGVWTFGSGVLLPSPVDGLVLTILDLPVISGRILNADGKAGVPMAVVSAVVLVDSGGPTPPCIGVRTDAEGRFRVAVDPRNNLESDSWLERHEVAGIRGVVIDASDSEGTGSVRRDIPLDDPHGPWDVGDIRLARTRALDFVVRSASGRPIEGAVGRAQGVKPSKPTDSTGRGHVDGLPEDANAWIVGAQGFAVTRVPLPSDPSETLHVVLAASNELVVHVREEHGPLSDGIAVELASDAPFFDRGDEKNDWSPDSVQTTTGDSAMVSATFGPAGGATRFRPDAEGRVVIHSLVPSKPFTIRVQGAAGKVLHEESAAGLAREEKRTVEIVLPPAGRSLAGRVVDGDGKPITGAQVMLFAGISGTGMGSDARGEFRFGGLGGGPFELTVSKAGYATLFDAAYELPAGAEPVEFRLEAGHLVRVRVVDASGAPVKDCVVGIPDLGGASPDARRVDAGAFEFPDLPARTLTFSARVGGIRYPKEHSALEPELTIVVPLHGSIEIRLPDSMAIDPAETVRLTLDPKPGLAPGSAIELEPAETHATRIRFGAVLPGDYDARLEQWSELEDSTERGWKRIGSSRAIVVRANETSTIDWAQ